MKKRSILTIILILILIPVVYFTTTTIMNNMEQENFYNTIKNVSNIENKSDKIMAEYIQNNSNDVDVALSMYNESFLRIDEELTQLKDLNQSLHNDTLKEYVNIEITRLEDEEKHWKIQHQGREGIKNYNSGKISASKFIPKNKELLNEANKTGTIVNNDKEKAEEFLDQHPDIKHKFEKLQIDEDFMIVENSEIDKKIRDSKK